MWFLLALLQLGHPCDLQAPTVYRAHHSQAPKLKLGFCFAPVDTDGQPITEPISFSLSMNQGPDIDLGELVPLTGPNAGGLSYYETIAPIPLEAGILVVKASIPSGSSEWSSPISLRFNGPPPP